MPKLLRTLGGAGAIYAGVVAGQEAEHARQRKRTLEGRSDRDYEEIDRPNRLRAKESADIQHGEFKRGVDEDAGARDVARRAAEEPQPAVPPAPVARALELRSEEAAGAEAPTPLPAGQASGARLLSETGGASDARPARTLSAAQPAQPAGAGAPATAAQGPNKALWARTAEAQRDYWTKRGWPDKAAKVMSEAINTAIAEREAKHKFEVLPKIEAIRERGLDAQALQGDQTYIDLRKKAAEGEVMTAGLMWGHVLNGNKKAAVDAFNASGVTQPGMQIADIGQSADGTKVFLLDKDGQVAKDKQGKPLVYPRQLLDNLWNQAQSSNLMMKKGDTMMRVTKEPGGRQSVTPIVTAPDPEADRRDSRERRVADTAENTRRVREDRAWGETINKARDDGDRLMRNAYMITTNPITGSVSGNVGKYRRAAKILEDKLAAVRQSGLRVDQVRANSLADDAMREAEDQVKRDAHGAGPRGGPASAAARGAPTWRDVLQ